MQQDGQRHQKTRITVDAIILARVQYVLPAWRGYLNEADIDGLQQLLFFFKT